MGNTTGSRTKGKRDQFVAKKKPSMVLYIVITVIALTAIGGGVWLQSRGSNVAQATPEEAKYLGRFLSQGYQPAVLTEPLTYDSAIQMSPVQPQIKGGAISISAADIIKNKIVYFEYTRPSDRQIIPMMAYIKPSGKLFTGVSFCPPCRGKYQHIEAAGTLTCNQCGTKRDLETQVGISGACKLYPPDEIAHKQAGDTIILAEADLATWQAQAIDRPVGGQ
ncbi:MAG TPA: Fe-S-containing protein [Candidatus Aquicultor sp.]|jgi:hypothetical protein